MSLAQRRGMADREHPSVVDSAAVRPAGSGPFQPVLSTQGSLRREPGLDASHGPAVPGYTLLRVEAQEGLAGPGGAGGRAGSGVQRLMRIMGLRAIYRSPRTSRPAPEHRAYPYLLEKIRVTRPNQAWVADITYLPMARGFLYLVAIMDWHSRYVAARRLSQHPGGRLLRRCLEGGAGARPAPGV